MRPFSEIAYSSLNKAVSVGYQLAGGVSVFAHVTRPKVATLSKYGSSSADNADIIMPIDVAVDLDAAAGHPVVTGKMAELLGYHLVPAENSRPPARPVSDCDAIHLMGEAMDVVRVLQAARADGKICAHERAAILLEIISLEQALNELKNNLDADAACNATSSQPASK